METDVTRLAAGEGPVCLPAGSGILIDVLAGARFRLKWAGQHRLASTHKGTDVKKKQLKLSSCARGGRGQGGVGGAIEIRKRRAISYAKKR